MKIENIKQTTEKSISDTPKLPIKEKPKMRQIVIETDGSAVRIVSADVAGNIELVGILEVIIDALRNKR